MERYREPPEEQDFESGRFQGEDAAKGRIAHFPPRTHIFNTVPLYKLDPSHRSERDTMRSISTAFCLMLLLFPVRSFATADGNKVNAEKRITFCYATDLSGKGCTPEALQRDGKLLLSAYAAGDRSVLPSLIRLSALSVGLRSLDTKFFVQAMHDDMDGFLSSLLSTQDAKDAWRNSGAVSSACDCPGIARQPFDEIRGMLKNARQESAFWDLAQRCRRDLEDTNATLIFTYFPPNTFQSRAGDFMVQWYSSVLYGLGEKPLWPADPKQVTYRFVWMRSFHDQLSITMEVQPDGDGQIRLQVFRRAPQNLESRTQSLSKQQVRGVLALIEEASFWKMTTQGGPQGLDGAEWVLEGVQGGQYHIVTRWDASTTAFGKPLLELLRLSNYNPPKDEIY